MQTDVATLHTMLKEVTITSDQHDLIKRTICQGATDQEMQLFFYDCTRRGVHPLDKLIHFTKRSGKYTPITSIDFMRQRAHESGAYAGEEPPAFTMNTAGSPESCLYTVYRLVQSQRCQWTATARWDEYYPGDQQGFMWKRMPFLMLSKCAEALALRKAFPDQLQGLYAKEEMDQAGPAQAATPSRKPSDILAESESVQGEAHESRTADPDPSVSDSRGAQGSPPAPSKLQDYISKAKLSQSVRECSLVSNEAEADPDLPVPDLKAVRVVVSQRMKELGGGGKK